MYEPFKKRRPANLLDGADYQPYLASGGEQGSEHGVASGHPGPHIRTASGESDVSDYVPTNYGMLDRSTVMQVKVGGVGVVHILADTEAVRQAQSSSQPSSVRSDTHDTHDTDTHAHAAHR